MTFWKDSLLIGVPQIDKQHRKLVIAIDELMEACTKGQGRATIEKTLLFAVSYAKEHFADEERLQAQIGYPRIIAHKRLHAQFIATVSALVKDFKENGPNVALVGKINNTLVEWLIGHISNEDKKIEAYMRSRNTK